jgi:hypothetical protein
MGYLLPLDFEPSPDDFRSAPAANDSSILASEFLAGVDVIELEVEVIVL